MDTPTQLHERVNQTISQSDLNRSKLSELSGIPRATLIRKLQGHSDFTVRELGSIAKALNLTIADLIPAEILESAA